MVGNIIFKNVIPYSGFLSRTLLLLLLLLLLLAAVTYNQVQLLRINYLATEFLPKLEL